MAFTSDTYSTDELWKTASEDLHLKAVFAEVSFPNEMRQLAEASKHLTPELLAVELGKLNREVDVYAVHIKPAYRDTVIKELNNLGIDKLTVMEAGRVYEW